MGQTSGRGANVRIKTPAELLLSSDVVGGRQTRARKH